MTDSAFDVSGPLRPGGTIRVAADGAEAHYVQVRRLSDGTTFEQAAAVVGDQAALDRVATELPAPSVMLTPGSTVEVTEPTLTAGEYLLLDWFPVEGDTAGAYHVDRGLVGHFTVAGNPVPEPDPTERYRLRARSAINGPRRLTAGHHVLHLDFGTGDKGFATLFRLEGSTSLPAVVGRLADAFRQEHWAAGTGMSMASYLVASLYPPQGTSLDVGVDLVPGTYVLAEVAYDNDGLPIVGVEHLQIQVG